MRRRIAGQQVAAAAAADELGARPQMGGWTGALGGSPQQAAHLTAWPPPPPRLGPAAPAPWPPAGAIAHVGGGKEKQAGAPPTQRLSNQALQQRCLSTQFPPCIHLPPPGRPLWWVHQSPLQTCPGPAQARQWQGGGRRQRRRRRRRRWTCRAQAAGPAPLAASAHALLGAACCCREARREPEVECGGWPPAELNQPRACFADRCLVGLSRSP